MSKVLALIIVLFISLNAQAKTCGSLFDSKFKPKQFQLAKDTPITKWTLEDGQYPDFSKIKLEDFNPAVDVAMAEVQEVVAKIKTQKQPTFENTILALELSDLKMKKFIGLYGTYGSSFATDAYYKVEEVIQKKLNQYETDLWMDQALFEKIEAVYKTRNSLEPDQKRLVESYRVGFVNNGLNLKGKERARYIAIREELSTLQNQFSKNLNQSRKDFTLLITNKEDLKGLSPDVIEALGASAKAKNKHGYLFTLEPAILTEAMEKLENSEIRKKLFMASGTLAYNSGKSGNINVVKKIAALKQEQSKLLGFKHYSEFRLSDNMMAKNLETVQDLVSKLTDILKPQALKEEQELKDFVLSKTGNAKFELWDRAYWISKLQKEKYSFNEDLIKQYLEYNRVQDAIFEIAKKLYGLNFVERTDLPKLDSDMQVFEVRDRNNELLSYLIVDPYTRLGTKNGGAWMSDVLGTYKQNGERSVPIISTSTNFTKPKQGKPLLLKIEEATTMFHEFGHALHGMLSQARYSRQAGTNVAWDFVELPSQFMENFFYEKEVLKMFAYHYKTKKLIPDDLVKAMIKSKQFRAASNNLGYLGMVKIDLAWHDGTFLKMNGSIFDMEQKILESVRIVPNTAGTVRSTYFGHIFGGGYASGYYSYKWAEILDADAFSIFKKEGLFNPNTADRFRTAILEQGSGRDEKESYIEFAGREPDLDALLKRDGITPP